MIAEITFLQSINNAFIGICLLLGVLTLISGVLGGLALMLATLGEIFDSYLNCWAERLKNFGAAILFFIIMVVSLGTLIWFFNLPGDRVSNWFYPKAPVAAEAH